MERLWGWSGAWGKAGGQGWGGAGMARHRLAILPGVTHYEMSDAPGLVDTALAFLEGAEKG